VIASDIGGMAEEVTDGVDGVHFRAGDPVALARTMQQALTGDWSKLVAGIRPPHTMSAHLDRLYDLYVGGTPAGGS
jgi:glycosyltransferase involved in cell wall biosynthesis